ncbi:DUF4124 domain-containing protein [Novilysobacter antarcticus]|uniref:DUF4124 domain-containing protein n=1 Tax=Novilysobacter antarcticus TaxID=2862543 RepID=UPI001C99282A|nr:DUF4124 domain-containing protein [Lysobacter antarcticus]
MKPGAFPLCTNLLALLMLAAGLALPTGARADTPENLVTIYRCTDAHGRLSLRDTPCRRGEQQETRGMQRPQDPPPPPPGAAAAPTPTVAVTREPEPTGATGRIALPPVYRCMTPDGAQYTSDSPEGNPRWVPLWTLGYPVIIGPGYGHQPDYYPLPPVRPAGGTRYGTGASPTAGDGRPGFKFDSVGRPSPVPSGSQPGVPDRLPMGGVVQGPGTWIRDTCVPIPQAEVCAELRERRTALTRRYNSALQSERRQIDAEKRRIDERLDTGCRP